MKILIVDDERAIRNSLGEILAECLNASIIVSSAIPCVDMDECNALRAERIKEILSDE